MHAQSHLLIQNNYRHKAANLFCTILKYLTSNLRIFVYIYKKLCFMDYISLHLPISCKAVTAPAAASQAPYLRSCQCTSNKPWDKPEITRRQKKPSGEEKRKKKESELPAGRANRLRHCPSRATTDSSITSTLLLVHRPPLLLPGCLRQVIRNAARPSAYFPRGSRSEKSSRHGVSLFYLGSCAVRCEGDYSEVYRYDDGLFCRVTICVVIRSLGLMRSVI